MDHKEQHHLKHEKEREHKKALAKQHEHQEEKELRTIHPLWFMVLGIVLIGGVIYVWTILW